MIKQYKVIQPIGVLEVGDVLTYDTATELYSFEQHINEDNYSSVRSVDLSPSMVEEYAKSGLVQAVETENKCCKCDCTGKLKQLSTLISQLKNTYNQRNETMKKKYDEGKIQTCVKVEHDTVYFNMMKLLNKLESIINE